MVLELLFKTIFFLFWSITQEPLDLLKFICQFLSFSDILLQDAYLSKEYWYFIFCYFLFFFYQVAGRYYIQLLSNLNWLTKIICYGNNYISYFQFYCNLPSVVYKWQYFKSGRVLKVIDTNKFSQFLHPWTWMCPSQSILKRCSPKGGGGGNCCNLLRLF